MKVGYDPEQGFIESPSKITHDIPDAQWAAYRMLVDAANVMEDTFVTDFAVEQTDEFAAVRGILTDEQIENLKSLGISMSDLPAGKVYHEVPATIASRPAISAEQAAREVIQRNAHKCQHRNQMGPFDDGTVRCRDCGGVLYGGTGVKKINDPDDPRHFHNPGSVDPHRFEGTVK